MNDDVPEAAAPGSEAAACEVGATPKPTDDGAIAEALEQISAIEDGEDDRRKTTDAKLNTAQSAVGFIVTLAGGSIALAFLQTPIYDLWHALVILALLVSVGFFVWAAVKIVAANDPTAYQSRTSSGVRRLLYEGKTKRELQLDAIDDLVCNVEHNGATNNARLTPVPRCYRKHPKRRGRRGLGPARRHCRLHRKCRWRSESPAASPHRKRRTQPGSVVDGLAVAGAGGEPDRYR